MADDIKRVDALAKDLQRRIVNLEKKVNELDSRAKAMEGEDFDGRLTNVERAADLAVKGMFALQKKVK